MSPQTRKERERAERHQRIIDTARELAETQGWEAVTVRRLAERIEYSQPVLYSHFAGKSAIVAAVAEQGIIDLTGEMRRAHAAAADPADAMARVARAYLDFAAAHPARYDAMFSMNIDLVFGLDAPQPLKDAFAELEAMFRPFVDEAELGARTEVAWSAIHGLATLDRGHRLRPELRDQRLEILVAEWLSAVGADSA
ncbi:TetR/AcrR family transcriptional regulator [Nocardia brasiliensis]|uniref:TetR family transcriptional regulator n=1 Tax=Nocardia brasiliensis (strain ATCC 700358 / HUJEG-1) TaxID=1133849 RepID=K0EYJ9_NOCB7|nr:TetR/AcrR family transcriptional regulator [Nocardia brasiliensis]AFU04988.1 TetR family transcriptional regulator [Nocardia brasiliensis ATCC 700358]OCF85415.1 TetR family transcriptional regulator [Nocardia brasiliensis]